LTAEVETVGAVPSNEKYAEKVLGRLAEAREEARRAIQKAQLIQKREYDRRHATEQKYEVGLLVWIQVPLSTNGRIPKWEHTWHGPFEVKEHIGLVNYRVKDLTQPAPTRVVHVRHMKVYHDPALREGDRKRELELDSKPNLPEIVLPKQEGEIDPTVMSGIMQPPQKEQRVGRLLQDEYEVEAILDKKRKKIGNKLVEHYLVKWKGYNEEHNSWVRHTRIQAEELVRRFNAERQERKRLAKMGQQGKVAEIDYKSESSDVEF
jgi:hypothetical protein